MLINKTHFPIFFVNVVAGAIRADLRSHDNGNHTKFCNLTRFTSDDSSRFAEGFVASSPFPTANGGDFEKIGGSSKLYNLWLRKDFVVDVVDETFTKLEARHRWC